MLKNLVYISLISYLILNFYKVESLDLLGDRCLLDSQCRTTQYCETDFPNPVGDCKDGKDEGELCLRDRTCASKKCHFFKCKKRLQVKDGPCKISVSKDF